MSTCIICGSDEKITYRILNNMKIALCSRHEDHAIGEQEKIMPLLEWI